MRIVYVVHQYLPRYFTGTEQYVHAIARAMQQRGHEVAVFTLEPDFSDRQPLFQQVDELVEGVPVTRLRAWYHLDRDYERMEYAHPFLAERFRRVLQAQRPDVVHVFHLRYLGADLIAEARTFGVPVVVHLMDFWFLCPAVVLRRPDGALCDGPPDGGLGCIDCLRPEVGRELDAAGIREAVARTAAWIPAGSTPSRARPQRAWTLTERPRRLRDALLRADRILAPSAFLKSIFVRNGYPDARIELLPYGVDPVPPLDAPARASGEAAPPLRVAFIGSIAEYKGVDLAVDAVLRTQAAIELSVHGRTADFPEFSKALLERAGGDPRIRFRGAFGRAELAAVLAATDLLVVPSRWYENTPFVVLEAFAAGVPVIASDLGGLAELVRDGVDGELFAAGDVADLSARLERLAAEPERLRRYRSGIRPIKTLDDNAAELDAIYVDERARRAAART